jgi:hypothetical protein
MEIKIVNSVVIQKGTRSYQEIVLSKGGAKLKVRVIDDINYPISSAYVNLTHSDFPSTLFTAQTDSNGYVSASALPAGEYSISTKTTALEDSSVITLEKNQEIEKIMLILSQTFFYFTISRAIIVVGILSSVLLYQAICVMKDIKNTTRKIHELTDGVLDKTIEMIKYISKLLERLFSSKRRRKRDVKEV